MYSLWLVPAEPLRSELRSIIQKLAAEHESVDFEPHVTVSAGGMLDDDETRDISHDIASRFLPVELAFQKLDYTNLFTKTLFVQFDEGEAARHIFDAIKERGSQTSKYTLNPHLSLLYKTMPVEAQAEICRTLEVPKGTYVFDRLRAIDTENPLTRPEQIKTWRTVFEAPLGRA
jgi:hypothetical protein